MRSVGSPSFIRLFSASVLAITAFGVSMAGCSDDAVRKSGKGGNNRAGNTGTSGDGSGGSSVAGSSASPGGSNASGGSDTAGTDSGSGGTGPSAGTAGTGTAGDTGVGGTDTGSGGSGASSGSGATTSSGGSGGSGPCQMAEYTFEPKIPTVFMLVDQSGSMFQCQDGGPANEDECLEQDNTAWYPLRDGALQVIQALQADVRFGFAPLGGEINNNCPNPEPVLPDFNNYEAISTRYNALMPPEKGETPVSFALQEVGRILAADDSPGDKFVLFVTDGEPDYCNDGDNLCPADSAIYHLQVLYEAGIQTLVLGLPAPGTISANAATILAAFANAGAGQPAVRPGGYDEFRLYDECNFKTPWMDDLELTGKPVERGSDVATYSETGGDATVFRPESTNQQELIDLLGTALSNTKSCTFDLSNVNGQSIKVDLNKLAEASVAIEGTTVAQDATNGWSMMSQTQLVLNGAACDTWRSPASDDIAFNFPCNTIIFE